MRLFPRFKHKQFIDTYLRDEPEQPTEEVIAGRRYRVDVPYVLPKDLQEVGRLDFQHYALRALLKGNYSAPLRVLAPKQILDVGCGTGRWCRDVANDCPEASITGLDLEAQWPTNIVLPPIIRFQQANILHGLPFAAGRFDYVHQRLLVGAIPARQWPFVLRELVRVTRAGGLIELLEASTFRAPGPLTQQLMQGWGQMAPCLGFDLSLMEMLGEQARQVGVQLMSNETIHAPLGAWGGHAGELLAVDVASVMQGIKTPYCTQMHMEADAYDALVAQLPGEWEQYHTTYTFHLVLGMKR